LTKVSILDISPKYTMEVKPSRLRALDYGVRSFGFHGEVKASMTRRQVMGNEVAHKQEDKEEDEDDRAQSEGGSAEEALADRRFRWIGEECDREVARRGRRGRRDNDGR
jgi:hypothetical protein